MFQSCRENQNTHFLCNNFFFSPENRAVYEMWKKMYSQTGHRWLLRMRIVLWIPKATNTHLKYVIFIVSPLQEWLHERAMMLRHTYIFCPVAKVTKCAYRRIKTGFYVTY